MSNFSPLQPLDQASNAPAQPGIYRILRNRQLIYVGQAQDLKRRLMEHRLCLTHLQIPTTPYQFRFVVLPRSTKRSRHGNERRIIDFHQRAGRLLQQREMEQMLAVAAAQNELEHTQQILDQIRPNEAEAFAVHRVAELPRLVNQRPRFRVASGQLSPASARSVGQRLPGVFVVGSAQHAAAFARTLAARTGGTVSGPEHHGDGISHYHVNAPGRRLHIWYRQTLPRGEFLY